MDIKTQIDGLTEVEAKATLGIGVELRNKAQDCVNQKNFKRKRL